MFCGIFCLFIFSENIYVAQIPLKLFSPGWPGILDLPALSSSAKIILCAKE